MLAKTLKWAVVVVYLVVGVLTFYSYIQSSESDLKRGGTT